MRSSSSCERAILLRTLLRRLLRPTNDRLPIEIFGYILTTGFDAFLAIQEELTSRLLDVITEHDLILAPPSLELRRSKERTG